MADSVGSLVDKLATVNQKMFLNQEILYKIRKMSFEEYKQEYFSSEDGAQKLWEGLAKAMDLNLQRNQIIDEIDSKIIEMIHLAVEGKNLDDGSFIQRKNKTY